LWARALAEKFPEGGGQRKRRPKNSKKDQKTALLSLLQGGGATEKRLKNSKKRPKNTMYENPGGPQPLPAPSCRRPCLWVFIMFNDCFTTLTHNGYACRSFV